MIARLKPIAIVAGLALGALALLSWTQVWVELTLTSGTPLAVTAETVSPALAALGLAMLALSAALSLAGQVVRVVLGVVQFAVAAGVLLTTLRAIADPVSAAAPAVSEATGIAGAGSVSALIAVVSLTAWPAITIALAVLAAVHGVLIVATGRRWSRGTRRFETTRTAAVDASGDAIDDWDALSGGGDPTAR